MTEQTEPDCPTCHHPATSHPLGVGDTASSCPRYIHGFPTCWDCHSIQAALVEVEITLYGQVLTTKFPGFFDLIDTEPINPRPALPRWLQALQDALDTHNRALQAARDFTDAMNKIVESTGATPDQIEHLQAQIMQMAHISGSSAAELAQGVAMTICTPATYGTPDAHLRSRPPTARRTAPLTPEPRHIPFDTYITVDRAPNGGYTLTTTRNTDRNPDQKHPDLY